MAASDRRQGTAAGQIKQKRRERGARVLTVSRGMRQAAMAGAIAALAFVGGLPRQAAAQDPSFFTLGLGYFFVIRDEDAAGAIGAEWMSSKRILWVLQPMVGAMATNESGLYGYAGVGTDIFFGRRWVLTPSVAAGAYNKGAGKDLGHTLEFRTGVSFAYRFDNRSRLGLRFYHMSNAGISERNPGVEVLDLTYSIPLN